MLLPLRSSRAALRSAALTPAPAALASPRKTEEHTLQRPAAYRPGERSARFRPPPLRRPWEAQPPLRVAVAHSPQKNTSEEDCFFCLANPTPQGGTHAAHHRRFTHVHRLSALVSGAGARTPPHHRSHPRRRLGRGSARLSLGAQASRALALLRSGLGTLREQRWHPA